MRPAIVCPATSIHLFCSGPDPPPNPPPRSTGGRASTAAFSGLRAERRRPALEGRTFSQRESIVEIEAPELRNLGLHLLSARTERGLSQSELAERCSLAQTQISYFEGGQRRPTLDQFLRIARSLDVSVQRLLSGAERPGNALGDIAVELRRLGVVDLWVKDSTLPGSCRRPEEVIALAVLGREPDPRIIEAIPAVLAWNEINPFLLRAYGRAAGSGTNRRLAWLADVTLAIERQRGFPGGCRKDPLERFIRIVRPPSERSGWDSLGKPIVGRPTSPLWKRWKIRYDARLSEFEDRARHLDELRKGTNAKRVPKRSKKAVVAQRVAPAVRAKRSARAPRKAVIAKRRQPA
jgi:transcriptional regulator with XRE-family HTH domain